jgi:hypothetical protein
MTFNLLFEYSKEQPKVTIGTLKINNGVYTWAYSDDCYAHNFNPFFYNIPGLPRGEVHTSDKLFSFFADRIPPRRRKDWLEIFGLTEYDELEIMLRSGLRAMTDTYELVKVGD